VSRFLAAQAQDLGQDGEEGRGILGGAGGGPLALRQ
jgi:hypothetical protein